MSDFIITILSAITRESFYKWNNIPAILKLIGTTHDIIIASINIVSIFFGIKVFMNHTLLVKITQSITSIITM